MISAGDSGDSKDGDKKDDDKKSAKDDLIGGDTNPEKERKEKEKNQDKYITDNDRKDPTGDMMPKGKKEKKKGPLEKAKAALKAAALAFKPVYDDANTDACHESSGFG